MVRWMVVFVVALGLLAAPPVGQALENALLTRSPAFGGHVEGGLIEVTLYQAAPAASADDRTCYSVHVEPRDGQTPPNRPTDHASACTWGALTTVYVQGDQARGRLVVRQGDQETSIPYLVPAGMSGSTWAGVEEGVLRIGTPDTLSPLHDAKEVTWSAVAAVAFLAVLVFLVARVHALWTLGALLTAAIAYGSTHDGWSIALPTAPLWAIGAAAALFLASMVQHVKRALQPMAGQTAPPDVSQDLPRLDAIGLREDLR